MFGTVARKGRRRFRRPFLVPPASQNGACPDGTSVFRPSRSRRPGAVWNSEPGDFVPWLLQPDNLGRLGDALRLDLEPVAREAPVGRFRADIVCRDRRGGGAVVIEAQLGPSDHSHLGQLLAYADGLDAGVVVWLGTSFYDEHRAVLGRLNRSGDLGLRCFAVAIDLWQIGGSPTAPQFTVLAAPPGWPGPQGRNARPPPDPGAGGRGGGGGGPPAAGRQPDTDPPAGKGPDAEAAGQGGRPQPRLRGAYRDRPEQGHAEDPGRHREGAEHAARRAGLTRAGAAIAAPVPRYGPRGACFASPLVISTGAARSAAQRRNLPPTGTRFLRSASLRSK